MIQSSAKQADGALTMLLDFGGFLLLQLVADEQAPQQADR